VIESVFMFKGIECTFTKKADDIVPSEEEKMGLLETFFSHEPIGSIQWVDCKKLDDESDELLPIYRIGDGLNELLLWPVLNGSDLILGIESADERPDLREFLVDGVD